jgi:hypothetical protein
MEIEWEMGAMLSGVRVLGQPFAPLPPDHSGNLRSCVRLARSWPKGNQYTIFLDRPVLGMTALGPDDLKNLPYVD